MGVFLAAVLLASSALFVAETAQPSPAVAETCSIGQPSNDFAEDVRSSARSARVWRLYQAFFLRQPDAAGMQYWVDINEAGTTLQDMSYNFERSQEFEQRYGDLSNEAFLTLIYQNVMCRAPDGQGIEYWLELLDAGEVNRGELMVLFSESEEFGDTTDTDWSIYDDADTSTFEENGYVVQSITGGLIVKVNYDKVDFKASHERCSIASINGNWFYNPETSNPTPIGFAVIDGQQIPGAVNTGDRGVFGERYRPNGGDDERVWVYEGEFNLNSNLADKEGRMLESWRSWQPASTPALDVVSEWRWAAGGIPLIVNGQVWDAFANIPTNDYTHYTYRHSFVAFDTESATLIFGSTVGMTSAQIIGWAQEHGYEDLIKFDGGGSVELNIDGEVRVAGTPRDVPLWLGIGC